MRRENDQARIPLPGEQGGFSLGGRGAAESLPASPASNESFPVNPPSMLPPHNAWGGSNAGLDMEAFGPSGTVVFRNHAFPLGDTPKEDAQGKMESH